MNLHVFTYKHLFFFCIVLLLFILYFVRNFWLFFMIFGDCLSSLLLAPLPFEMLLQFVVDFKSGLGGLLLTYILNFEHYTSQIKTYYNSNILGCSCKRGPIREILYLFHTCQSFCFWFCCFVSLTNLSSSLSK